MKALVVGPSLPVRTKRGIELEFSKSFVNSPSLTDFKILVIQYSRDRMSRHGVEEKRNELKQFLHAGGYCIVLPLDPSIQRTARSWCPAPVPRLVPREGTSVLWKRGSLVTPLVEGIRFRTHCTADIRPEESATVLAKNNAGFVVAFSISTADGRMLFLPAPGTMFERGKFVKAQIEHVSDIIAEMECKPPSWFLEVTPTYETHLAEQLSRLRRARCCLYATGRLLSKSVFVVIDEMLRPLGFVVEYLEDEGREDICAQSINHELRFECKGLKGYANVDDLRQLLDHCTRRKSKAKLKGVFVVNHSRDEPPKDRGLAATKEAVDLAVRHKYSIVTTISIFEAYLGVLEGRLKREDFLSLLLSSAGLIDAFPLGTGQ